MGRLGTFEELSKLGILKNKFSGNRLFRTSYYNLVTGDLSIFENTGNRWFYESLILHASSKDDISLIPALKKVAADTRFDESIRQKASEAVEFLEEKKRFGQPPKPLSVASGVEEKLDHARRILAGTRLPQTAEILRLLRDKSVEVQRMAIYIIGKFRITEMTQDVCLCLNIPGLETDAGIVLHSLGSDISRDLRRFYLISSGNAGTSAMLLRILGSTCTPENTAFFFSRLWSNSRYIKEIALNGLVECDFKTENDETDQVVPMLYEISGIIVWLLSARLCLNRIQDTFLLKEINSEYNRWNSFLMNLLSVVFDSGTNDTRTIFRRSGEDVLTKEIPEIIRIIKGDSSKAGKTGGDDLSSEERKFKKLSRHFPVEMPGYKRLLEDIINCDYNVLNIWTKASALRSIKSPDGKNLAESVVALLFSQELILQEEAVRLLAGSDKELYKSVSERIQNRDHLDKIMSGEADQRSLVYEKTKFLASFFTGIPEDELIMLAGKLRFIKDSKTLSSAKNNEYLLWSFLPGKVTPAFYIQFEESGTGPDEKIKATDFDFHYMLPLPAIEEFHSVFPDHSFEIFRNLDANED